MEKSGPSPNFKSLLKVLIEKDPPSRKEFITCLAFLPTIREDIQFLFHYLSLENDTKRLEMYIIIIFEIFSKKNPADFNFMKGEVDSMLQSLILMNHKLSFFNMCRDYVRIIVLLLSIFKENNDMLQIRRFMQQSINIEAVYSALAICFPNIREEAFRFVVKDNSSHLLNPISLFSFSNILLSYKKYDNVPEALRDYLDPKTIVEGLQSHGQPQDQIVIVDQSNKKENQNLILNLVEDPTQHDFVLFFLYCIQGFYTPDRVMFFNQTFVADIIFPSIKKSPQSRNLVAELISVMPASEDCTNFKIDSQVSSMFVPISDYITDYTSKFSQRVFEFCKKRQYHPFFTRTMIRMPSRPEKYTAAILIGLGTNMFGNSEFVEGCFPAKVNDTKFFVPILNAIPFLLQKNFIQESNIGTILTSVFSILSHPASKSGDILELAINGIQGMINANLTSLIYNNLVENISHILTDCLIPIIDLLIKNRNTTENVESQKILSDAQIKKYFNCVAVVARSIESDLRSDQEKLSLLNFLNILNGYKISEQPEEKDDRNAIINYWDSMKNKFTIIYIVNNFVLSLMNSDRSSPNLLSDFYSTVCQLFDEHESFSVVVSVLPSNENTKQTIEKANLLIDSQFKKLENKSLQQSEKESIEEYFCDCFVSFYKTRLFVDQSKTINDLISLLKKEKLKLLKPYLKLIIVLCHQINYQEFIYNSTINPDNKNKDDKLKKKEFDTLCDKISKLLEDTKISKISDHKKEFEKVQIEARSAVFEAARNPDVNLPDSFIKGLINYPFFYNSYSYLLRKLKNKDNIDAKVAADACVNHLKNRDHDHILNEETAKEIVSTISDNKQIAITSIVSTLINEISINDNEDEDDEIYTINDQKAYSIINFLEFLAINGCSKEYIEQKQDPEIILFFSRFCYSKVDRVRISAFRFIMNYFAVKFPYVDKLTNTRNIDPLYYYQNKHTGADRVLVFLSLFNRVFAMRKVLAGRVFEEISKKKVINIYHVLLCKSIVEVNFNQAQNILNFNISYDEDAPNSDINNPNINYNYNYNPNLNNYNANVNNYNPNLNNYNPNLNDLNRPILNPLTNQIVQNQLMNPINYQNVNSSYTSTVGSADQKDISNDSSLSNDEMISNDVLYKFSKRTFATSKTSFEAQEVMKLIAIKDIDKFIHFLMANTLTDFMRCVVKRIMYSTVLRNKFIDSFICYIMRCGVKMGSNQAVNENKVKITNEEVQFLSIITMSDSSGELKYINSGKLILIVVMLIGISYRSKKRKELKKNSLLSETLSSIVFPNSASRKQVGKQPRLIPLNTDDYNNFSYTLKLIANELMNLNASKFKEFCICCKNCVKIAVDCVSCSIGVLMIHLSQTFTDFGSSTTIQMKDYLWNIVSKAVLRKSPRNRRLFARILNQVLNNPIIKRIDNISKDHIFHSILDSLTEELDDFKSDAVEIVCTFYGYVQNMNKDDIQLRDLFIKNLQKSFTLTTKEKEQRRKERERELKAKLLENNEKPKETKPKSRFLFFSKDKSTTNTNENIHIDKNDDDKSEEFDFSILVYNVSDENTLRLNQSLLSALKLLASTIPDSEKLSIFGSWKSTRLSMVDVAEVIVKGTKIEQQLALELFMILFKVQSNEDVIKRLILNMKEEDFSELCRRIIPADVNKIDRGWIEVLMWIFQSFQGHRTIDPSFKQQLFSMALEISCIEGHKCRELALEALNIFSR